MRECKLRSGVILEETSKEKRVKQGVGVLSLFFFLEVWSRGMAVSLTEVAIVLMCNFHGHFTL
jgi:hypothetical protein